MTDSYSNQQSVKLHISRLYAQATDSRWEAFTSTGACFGLSVWWIIKNALGEEYWDWLDAEGDDAREKIEDAVRHHIGCSELLDQRRFNVAQAVIKGYVPNLLVPKTEYPVIKGGLEFTGPVMRGRDPTDETEIKPGYYYISLEGIWPGKRDRTGHGIAAYVSAHGPCRYIDPNLGEGEVATPEELTTELEKIVDFYGIKDAKASKVRFVLR